MNEPAQVIVVGSYVQDHSWLTDRFPQVGETRRAIGFNTSPGGKGFNQAIACSRQGVATLFVGAIGADSLGEGARRFAADENLPCRWQVCADTPTAAACVLVDRSGANLIVVNVAANEFLAADFIAAQADAFSAAKIVLLQLETHPTTVAATLDLARRHALLRVLNPAPMDEKLDISILSHCDMITPNETEFAQLLERCTGERVDATTLAARDDADLHWLARRLGVDTLLVTLGAHGCFVSHGREDHRGDGDAFYRLPAERVNSIDSTGAGDAFSGALVAALVRFDAQPFRVAVVHANRAAALSTESIGAAPTMPSFDAVQRRFNDRESPRDHV